MPSEIKQLTNLKNSSAVRSIDRLPGPRNWPLLGSLMKVKARRIHLDMEQWCHEYGPLFRVYLGRRLLLVVARHTTVTTLLKHRPDGFRRPGITAQVSAEAGGLPNVFMAEGTAWRNQRRMVMAGFAPKAIKAYYPALVNVGQRLQRKWTQAAQHGIPIDVSADLKRYTVDIIAGLAFGQDVNTLEAGDNVIQRHLDEILPAIARRSLSPIPYWRYFKLPQDRRLEASSASLRAAVYALIDQARARMRAHPQLADKPNNLLEALLAAADQPNSGIDNDMVAGNVTTMLLAGEDTTANTIAWLLYLLHTHPAALAKATEELKQVARYGDQLTLGNMDELVYLSACIDEAMRLKPVAPFLPLEALHDTLIEDVHVPAGTLVWCVMRRDSVDERYVANPKSFEPERWMASTTNALVSDNPLDRQVDALELDKRTSMPFGAGPRTCPGRYLALLEVKIAVAMVLRHFEIDSLTTPDGKAPQEMMAFVMSPVGLSMRLRLRSAPAFQQ